MPIKLKSYQFTDIYGNITNSYKANAGDKIHVRFDFDADISVQSNLSNFITINKINDEVKQMQGSFINEGFRVGDQIRFLSFNNSNAIIDNYLLTITGVSDLVLNVTGLPSLNGYQSTKDLIFLFYSNRRRDEVEFSLNWADNGNPQPSFQSPVDQEAQRFVITGVGALPIDAGAGPGNAMTQIGKKSGSFSVENCAFWHYSENSFPYYTDFKSQTYVIQLEVTDIGVLFENSFIGSECLKFISQFKFRTIPGENFTTDLVFNEEGNTGYFNEAFNTDASIIVANNSTNNSLYYNEAGFIVYDFTIDNQVIDKIEVGACFITFDSSYNLNKADSQNKYLMLLKTGLIDSLDDGTFFNSEGDYTYQIKSTGYTITDIGTERNITGTLTFDPQYSNPSRFGKFLESRGDGDRLFLVWAKVGNTNVLLFGDQLQYKYPVGQEYTPELSVLVNHGANLNYSDFSTPAENEDFNTEDDLGYIQDFSLFETDLNQQIICQIVARNTVTNDEFILDGIQYDLTNQSLVNFIDQQVNVSNNLPTDSSKKISYLKVKVFFDVIKVRIYFPFLINWRYWLTQLNANVFFKAQNLGNKDWYNFQDVTNNWNLEIKTGILRNGVLDYHYKPFSVLDYDEITNVNSVIELFDYPSLTPLNAIIKGKQILVKATHTTTAGAWLTPFYANVTIEQKEGQPRHLISNVYNNDPGPTNALYGLTNNRLLDAVKISANVIETKCLIDTNKLTENEYCLTAKVSDDAQNFYTLANKITEAGVTKITEGDNTKITE
jgi:hypothetical protein